MNREKTVRLSANKLFSWLPYMSQKEQSPIWFTSLGMVVLDELNFATESFTDVLGGSGTYSTMGARIFRPFPDSASVGWMIRAGDDFPPSVKTLLESWKCALLFRNETDKLSTRGRLTYKDELGTKSFEYVTPILPIAPDHIRSTRLLLSRSFHILSTPEELINQVSSLIELRHKARVEHRPLIIWEPRPSSCAPENQNAFFQAVQMVDIFSPNHIELALIFGNPSPEIIDPTVLERYASRFIESGLGQSNSGAVVLRAGDQGCLVVSNTHPAKWIPSYYPLNSEAKTSKVVDPTGAGNAFLGAFAIGYLDTRDFVHAACYGNVGASFALEQIGVPTVEVLGAGKELWNGSDVYSRLRDYRAQLK